MSFEGENEGRKEIKVQGFPVGFTSLKLLDFHVLWLIRVRLKRDPQSEEPQMD